MAENWNAAQIKNKKMHRLKLGNLFRNSEFFYASGLMS